MQSVLQKSSIFRRLLSRSFSPENFSYVRDFKATTVRMLAISTTAAEFILAWGGYGMRPFVEQLQEALQRANRIGSGTRSSLDEAAEWSISPWSVWTILSLIRHADRQEWVGHLAVSRLSADLEALSQAGALAHPDIPQKGLVPDLTEWEYYFHGRGCLFSHRVSGEQIDVDFYDGSSEWIDDFFFLRYVESIRSPDFVEARLIALHPTLETIKLAFEELLEQGVLEQHSESKVFRVIPECRELCTEIDRLNANCQSDDLRIAAAVIFGDWQPTHASMAGNLASSNRWQTCIAERQARLTYQWRNRQNPRVELLALCDLGLPETRQILAETLQGRPSGAISAALHVIGDCVDEDWSSEVWNVLQRINPCGGLPQPHIWLTCAEYLLSRDRYVDEIRTQLSTIDARSLGDAAVLALEFLPELAIDLFRRALRSQIPGDRTTAAAALAILVQPWSRAELAAVLQESTDQQATSECRAALSALPHPELHRLVRDWEQRNLHEPEVGPFVSMAEMSLRTRDTWVQYEMEKLHERVIKLRSQNVPRSNRSRWWPFSR